MSLVVSGCGLVWSFEPPQDEMDASSRDAGHVDGGRADGGRVDGGPPTSDGGGSDAGPDGGLDGGLTPLDGQVVEPDDAGLDSGPLRIDASTMLDADIGPNPECEEICASDHYCDRPEGRCIGPASCIPLVDVSCPPGDEPVCGCDRRTYRSECVARNSGVSILSRGMCPDFGAFDWCNPGPTIPPSPSGCTRCFDDADCPSFFPLCIGSACGPSGDGVCAAYAGPGTCYYDYECGETQRCVGAFVHGCRADRLPDQGSCEFP